MNEAPNINKITAPAVLCRMEIIKKAARTYKAQIELDINQRASKIDVTGNRWQGQATMRALEGRGGRLAIGSAFGQDQNGRQEVSR